MQDLVFSDEFSEERNLTYPAGDSKWLAPNYQFLTAPYCINEDALSWVDGRLRMSV